MQMCGGLVSGRRPRMVEQCSRSLESAVSPFCAAKYRLPVIRRLKAHAGTYGAGVRSMCTVWCCGCDRRVGVKTAQDDAVLSLPNGPKQHEADLPLGCLSPKER